MLVHRIVNSFHSSNTFILELSESKVLLIDVGSYDKIDKWLVENNKEVYFVILTHEHTDHCHGVNKLYKKYKFELICSSECAKNITDSKQNLSKYIDEINTFEINIKKTIIVKDMCSINMEGKLITFIETPGHSPGSMCILIEDMIFTGDTILNGIKTPLNLPHSNWSQYKVSIDKLSSYINSEVTIFPGHDIPFKIHSFDNLLINI